MAFLRFSRDKRGYEHFYLIETPPQQRGRSRSRILYWFRTPPGVKVGREPFDAEARRALEDHNPGAMFDWQKFISTPIPPVEQEHWRERRRVERAAKIAARVEAAAESEAAAEGEAPEAEARDAEAPDVDTPVMRQPESSREFDAAELPPASEPVLASDAAPALDAVASRVEGLVPSVQPAGHAGTQARRRRRRRRRGPRSGPSGAFPSAGTTPSNGPQESPEMPEPAEPSTESGPFDPGEGGDV